MGMKIEAVITSLSGRNPVMADRAVQYLLRLPPPLFTTAGV